MLSRVIRASLCLGGAVTAACSDAPTSVNPDTSSTTSAPTTTTNCTPLTMTVGQVVAGLSASSTCFAAGTSAAEYALIPFNASTISTSTTSIQFTATGTAAPGISASLIPSASASLDLIAAAASPSSHPDRAFESRLRMLERSALPARISAARAWERGVSSGARLDAIPGTATIGQLLQLNANADVACTSPTYRTGRVVAITNRAIVVADTGNPSGGYTDAEYASMGAAFDTLIDPLDRAAFGDPSDIDHNGRIVLFFTKTVNDLTPKSSSSYIGGYFFARDLFPVTDQMSGLAACAGSNVGEMFYVMVPDPSRGGAFAKANVASEVYATLAHEYQHLINASRRMYVNTAATDFEETWLDEGLAHIAEELLFYRASGLSPRANIDVATLRTSSAIVDAFNNYEIENFGRYVEYLKSPSKYSPYADNDSLATRGATWAFLRSAADRRGSSDGDTWYQLVNSTTTGIANLQHVFGTGVSDEIRDWATSVLTDDMTGVSSAYQQPSWNFRSIFAALGNSVFPISTVSLLPGTQPVTLTDGAAAYLRFTVPAGGLASVQWSAPATAVQFTVVRTR